MSIVMIKIEDDASSIKLFLELARKLRYKARVLSDEQKEDVALLKMMDERRKEPSLPVESTYKILRKGK
jgi:hypothetical protein